MIKIKAGHSNKSNFIIIAVFNISNNNLMIYDDTPDDFTTLELSQRSHFSSKRSQFKLGNVYDHSKSSDKDKNKDDKDHEIKILLSYNVKKDSSLVNMFASSLMMKSATITLNDEKNLAQLWHEEINNDVKEVIYYSKRVLTDFCKAEIEEFLSKEIIEQILGRYLKVIDKNKLKKCGTIEKLVLFIRE
ncbi:8047_t:CDS:2 [Funneliformis caledonium]|uniref:8047_t:CDS:1 n=1 Tax=Funneliformis caledonium TaxID=1117310 RepID=A0A9N8ZPX4_9GLOM|nr:8047_t:CDS:2 [Funneliformis caledonium]